MNASSNQPTLNDLAGTFLSATRQAEARDQAHFQAHVDGGHGWRIENGLVVLLTQEMLEHRKNLVDAVCKELGSKIGFRETIERICWAHATRFMQAGPDPDVSERARFLTKELRSKAHLTRTCTFPNYTLLLCDGVQEVVIGPVIARRSELLTYRVRAIGPKIIADGRENDPLAMKTDIFHLPDFCWQIDLIADLENIRGEASWIIDVAISFFRLFVTDWEHPVSIYPGLKEPPLFEPWRGVDAGLIETKDSGVGPGHTPAPFYKVTDAVRVATEAPLFKETARILFKAKSSALASRCFDGLGWLTRARRAQDKSERFLFCFTALEALVGGAKGEPVNQTIFRGAAAIATDNIAGRHAIYQWLKALYDKRSRLVHNGVRDLWIEDVDEVQTFTEGLYTRVLRHVDLSMSQDVFRNELARASHGFPWRPRL